VSEHDAHARQDTVRSVALGADHGTFGQKETLKSERNNAPADAVAGNNAPADAVAGGGFEE
jgi:hypothetical protein